MASIKCAHCKGRHQTVAQVRLCAHRAAAPAVEDTTHGAWDAKAEAREYDREMAAAERGEDRERYL